MKYAIATNTPSYKRIISAGFVIEYCKRQDQCDLQISIILITFTCVCKIREVLIHKISPRTAFYMIPSYGEQRSFIDATRLIEEVGVLSEEHLRKDGFSEEQIKFIMDEIIELSVFYKYEISNDFLIGGKRETDVWLPKNQCKYSPPITKDQMIIIQLPKWLALEKGLIEN